MFSRKKIATVNTTNCFNMVGVLCRAVFVIFTSKTRSNEPALTLSETSTSAAVSPNDLKT